MEKPILMETIVGLILKKELTLLFVINMGMMIRLSTRFSQLSLDKNFSASCSKQELQTIIHLAERPIQVAIYGMLSFNHLLKKQECMSITAPLIIALAIAR